MKAVALPLWVNNPRNIPHKNTPSWFSLIFEMMYPEGASGDFLQVRPREVNTSQEDADSAEYQSKKLQNGLFGVFQFDSSS